MRWTPEEDAVLAENIGKYKTKIAAYRATSEQLINRTVRACEDRWIVIKDVVKLEQEIVRLRKEAEDADQLYEDLLSSHYQYIDKCEKLKFDINEQRTQIERAKEQKKQDDVVIAELQRLIAQMKTENEESLQEYHQLLKIMNRARQLLVDDEYHGRKRSFVMDYNGNLEYAR